MWDNDHCVSQRDLIPLRSKFVSKILSLPGKLSNQRDEMISVCRVRQPYKVLHCDNLRCHGRKADISDRGEIAIFWDLVIFY